MSYLIPVRGASVQKCLVVLNNLGAGAVASEVPGYIVARRKVDTQPHYDLTWIEIPDEAFDRYSKRVADITPAIKPGTPIEVVKGPLVGFKGIVAKVYDDTNILVVNLWAFGRTVRHEVNKHDVNPLPSPNWA